MSEYIGRRIVPVHGGVWSGSKSYEELTIVLHEDSGDSYISRRAVPAGTAITDESYWMLHSLYSQQIADAVAQMEETESKLTERVEEAENLTNSNKNTLNSRMDSLETRMDANVSASTDADADYAAEVVDARVDNSDNVYASLGAHLRAIADGSGIDNGAVAANHVGFLDITPELDFTADEYIVWKTGRLQSYTSGTNVYFATEDYVEFPYGGSYFYLRCAKSTASNDASGIAFYDEDKSFISGSDYCRDSSGLEYTRILCPEGTAFMRLTCYKEANVSSVKIWVSDVMISTGRIVAGAVTEDKLADGSVTGNKLADDCVTEGKIADGAVTEDKLGNNAVTACKNAVMKVPLELNFTADKYISRINGQLQDFTSGTNTYFATEDFLAFPYGGCSFVIRSSMTTASSDKSGLAFYDVDQKFISGLQYDQVTTGVACNTEFVCPEGTAYIRLTCHTQSLLTEVGIWCNDLMVPESRIVDGAVSTEKIADGAVTEDKLADEVVSDINSGINCVLAETLPENPLEYLRETPGYLSVFLHVGCIGDSLASGEAVYMKSDGTTGGLDKFDFSWGQYLARMTGNTYYNWSKGGLRCDTFLSSSLATECFDGEHLCEAYIIGLGQNEKNKSYTIGTADDIDLDDYSNNADSYYGNYGKIISKIKEVQPKAKIFILTDPLSSVESAGYNDAVREIATLFDSVYLVDLYTYGSSLYTSTLMKAHKRGGHYDAVGYYLCAMVIATYIDWLIKKYPEEFREVEFIGTDYYYYS